ncbi:hypothetical protein BDZ91DRAFT_722632 [Kalaharituber pfeilii]|nr:hypothetical protein BDZ91DRAFT_722632 [Kalaharituber pfeilii]
MALLVLWIHGCDVCELFDEGTNGRNMRRHLVANADPPFEEYNFFPSLFCFRFATFISASLGSQRPDERGKLIHQFFLHLFYFLAMVLFLLGLPFIRIERE